MYVHTCKADLRRISALLLCQLFNNNAPLKLAMVYKMCLPLSRGRVSLPRLRLASIASLTQRSECRQMSEVAVNQSRVPSADEISTPKRQSRTNTGEDGMFCWAINLEKRRIELQLFEPKKYSSFTFLDPLHTVFGVTLSESDYQQHLYESMPIQTSVLPKRQQKKEITIDMQFGSQTQRKYSKMKNVQALRPSTVIVLDKEQQFTSCQEKPYNFLNNYHDVPFTDSNVSISNSYGVQEIKQKMGTSIQSISQYARSSYGRQSIDKAKDKQRFSISYEQKYQTDRTFMDRFQQKKGSQIEYSKNKIRSSSKTPKNYHQNFYKRVQQILRN